MGYALDPAVIPLAVENITCCMSQALPVFQRGNDFMFDLSPQLGKKTGAFWYTAFCEDGGKLHILEQIGQVLA